MVQTQVETESIGTLEEAQARIDGILRESEQAIGAVAGCFEALAQESSGVLTLAGDIVGCIEDAEVRAMLPRVQALGSAAKGFIHERLQATSGVLEMVASEAKLLERLARLTRSQRSVARETQTLSVLTNIEVARLGSLGSGFQYLAHQLDEFSRSVAEGTKQLSAHTEERQRSISETRKLLAAGLPRIQKEFARIEEDLAGALEVAGLSHQALSRAPGQFQFAVTEISGQISGVVAAVQGHDITRQQLEHVRNGLAEILQRARGSEELQAGSAADPMIGAGLLIQSWQLRSIEATVSDWIKQIADCAEKILHISASELYDIGPAVLRQEQELSEQLARIEHLESECDSDSAEVQATFSSLNNLMQLVAEHVERSHEVRDRLQLLTFNSIVEASHLGTQADAILEISQSIKRLSEDWSALTDSSATARDEILHLVEETQQSMQTFSEEGTEGLRQAQEETRHGLQHLRNTAQCAATRVSSLETATGTLHSRLQAISDARQHLESCFTSIGTTQAELELERSRLGFAAARTYSEGEIRLAESIFAHQYTTELEREVLRAALRGGELPLLTQSVEGNDVELF